MLVPGWWGHTLGPGQAWQGTRAHTSMGQLRCAGRPKARSGGGHGSCQPQSPPTVAFSLCPLLPGLRGSCSCGLSFVQGSYKGGSFQSQQLGSQLQWLPSCQEILRARVPFSSLLPPTWMQEAEQGARSW